MGIGVACGKAIAARAEHQIDRHAHAVGHHDRNAEPECDPDQFGNGYRHGNGYRYGHRYRTSKPPAPN